MKENILDLLFELNFMLKDSSRSLRHILKKSALFTHEYAQGIMKEFTFSTEMLRDIYTKHKGAQSDPEPDLREFFKNRWEIIHHTTAAYVEFPEHPLNIACQRLAIALAYSFANDDGEREYEPTARILMPTIKATYYTPTHTSDDLATLTQNPDRTLATHRFIVSDSGEGVIPLLEWLEQCKGPENTPYINHLYGRNEQSEYNPVPPEDYHEVFADKREDYIQANRTDYPNVDVYMNREAKAYYDSFIPVPLTEQDLTALETIALPESRRYIEQIRIQKSSLAVGMKGSFDDGLVQFIQDLKDCGNAGIYKRQDGLPPGAPHPKVAGLALNFLHNYWDKLSLDRQAEISKLTVGGHNFEKMLLRVRYEVGHPLTAEQISRVQSDYVTVFCVEQLSDRFNDIRTKNLNTFKEINDKTLPHEPILSAVKSKVSEQKKGKLNAERYKNNASAISNRFEAQLYTEPTQDIDTLLFCKKHLTAEKFDRLVCQNTSDQNASVIFALEYDPIDARSLTAALVKNGANLRKKNNNHQTILCIAIANDWDQVIDACLCRDDFNLNTIAFNHTKYLDIAIQKNRPDLIIKLINHGTELNARLLRWAIQNHYPELILLLIQKNILSMHTPASQTSVFRAALLNNWNAVSLACLSKTNLNLTSKSADGWSLLHYAARHANLAIFTELLKHYPKDSINDKTTDQNNPRTALQIAFNYDHMEHIALLIQQGADFSGEFGTQNESLLTIALKSDWTHIIKAILSHTPFDSMLVNPLLNNIYTQYGHQQTCDFFNIQPNSNKALKIYAQAHLNHLEQKRTWTYFKTYPTTHPKVQKLRQGIMMNAETDTEKEACNKTLLTALHMHSKQTPKQAEAKSFRDLPEPLKTRFFS